MHRQGERRPGRIRLLVATLVAAAALTCLGSAATAGAQSSPLRYFGYFAARLTASGGNHLAEVSQRSNLNWVQISDPDRYAPEVLDGCRPRGCIISTGNEFFRGCDSAHSPTCELYPNFAARWARLADAVRSRIGKVGAFYLMDEPQYRGATRQELQLAAATIKATYPQVPVMMVEAGPQVSASIQIPTAVDWVGFDWYCQSFTDVNRTLHTLTGRIHPNQSLFLLPEAAPLQACGGSAGHATDAEIAPLQFNYLHLAQSNPRVIGLLAFGFWTSGYGSAQLPRTVAAHQLIYRLIAGLPVRFAHKRARLAGRKVRVVLKCPKRSPRDCPGELSLLRGRKGAPLGSKSFDIAAGKSKRVAVKIGHRAARKVRRALRHRSAVKLRATALTPAGQSAKKIGVSARGR
ncbi:MAG TPA: hypothetical protein VH501_01175 [Solirubrobacterales bacterium]|jgi:hypothetical protein